MVNNSNFILIFGITIQLVILIIMVGAIYIIRTA